MRELLKLDHSNKSLPGSFGISTERGLEIARFVAKVSTENKTSVSVEHIWNGLPSNNEKAFAIFLFGSGASRFSGLGEIVSIIGIMKCIREIAEEHKDGTIPHAEKEGT